MPLYLKKRTFDQCVLPVMTYGCETWTLKSDLTNKLQVVQNHGTEYARNNKKRPQKNNMD